MPSCNGISIDRPSSSSLSIHFFQNIPANLELKMKLTLMMLLLEQQVQLALAGTEFNINPGPPWWAVDTKEQWPDGLVEQFYNARDASSTWDAVYGDRRTISMSRAGCSLAFTSPTTVTAFFNTNAKSTARPQHPLQYPAHQLRTELRARRRWAEQERARASTRRRQAGVIPSSSSQ